MPEKYIRVERVFAIVTSDSNNNMCDLRCLYLRDRRKNPGLTNDDKYCYLFEEYLSESQNEAWRCKECKEHE